MRAGNDVTKPELVKQNNGCGVCMIALSRVSHTERDPKPKARSECRDVDKRTALLERAANDAHRTAAAVGCTRLKACSGCSRARFSLQRDVCKTNYYWRSQGLGSRWRISAREYYGCAKMRAPSGLACLRSRRTPSSLLRQHARQGWLRGPSRTGNAPEPPSSPHNSRAAPGLIRWRSPRGATREHTAVVKCTDAG